MKIGIIREEKNPPDSRVTLNPQQCKKLLEEGWDLVVQPSKVRCFTDEDYKLAGVPLKEDLTDRQVLIGVKEVPIDSLIEGKTYFFFSHTIKEQPYNQKLLQAVVAKGVRLIDYEVLTNEHGARVIAFGEFAGMVGAHNGVWTYGCRTGAFELPRMKDLYDYTQAQESYKNLSLPPIKVVVTGTGRVAQGAVKVLEDMGFERVSPIDYVVKNYDMPVFTQLNSFFYAKRRDGKVLDSVQDFYDNPRAYESDFDHFLPMTDVMINGIYWDNEAPAFFTLEQMKNDNFNIKVIADVTCDIAPVSSIPSTLRPTTIPFPVFGFDPITAQETDAHNIGTVDMMTIDNLPNELPRDASTAFGEMFMKHVLPKLKKTEKSLMLQKATIAENNNLGSHFEYLRNYLEGKA